jgi:hypothetical protein
MATAYNPFDLSKTTGADLLTGATSVIAAPETTGYNAATASASGYNPTNAQAFSYDPSTANVTNWNVGNDQTVQGQLQGIIAANSPLMQQAQTSAMQQMNRRGLMNSSMAIGAGQDAVIRQALPIAQQDAQMFGRAGEFNAGVANQMAQFNVGQLNQAGQFGAAASNQAALSNQNAANQAGQFSASAANQASLANVAAQNQAAQYSASAINEASQQYAQALNATTNKMLDQSMQYALANADSETKLALQNIDASTRKDLAATEAAYKNQMQASASANEIFQQVSKNIADIMANPDLEPGPKQSAIDSQKVALQNALTILSATSGIPNLRSLLDFA